ncbi:biphenyl-2,3-diol 1,2-dioxygenase [Bacillus licheniformis CG-B52]|jgi:hypothetical protein|uniref:GloA protein n=2 Tax=Bacillus licheniformis TaxID=1402 RepID=Q0JXY4_BACLI|nr:biphenyl-2,3-diol 1,2-dioxygenase [Bacillus licheniformis CG-B52]CAK18198.1 GloA protein [Bacillus licheniformis]CAK18206.1 GloA protein [Bacillus licheniformis]
MSRRQLFQWPNDPRQALFKKIFIALLFNSCYNVKKQTIKGDGVMKIDRMDHLVLTVKDIDATCDFYSRVPGLNAVTFREGRKARHSAGKK